MVPLGFPCAQHTGKPSTAWAPFCFYWGPRGTSKQGLVQRKACGSAGTYLQRNITCKKSQLIMVHFFPKWYAAQMSTCLLQAILLKLIMGVDNQQQETNKFICVVLNNPKNNSKRLTNLSVWFLTTQNMILKDPEETLHELQVSDVNLMCCHLWEPKVGPLDILLQYTKSSPAIDGTTGQRDNSSDVSKIDRGYHLSIFE